MSGSKRHEKRQPKGIPIGGEYAPNEHEEARSPLMDERALRQKADAAVVASSGAESIRPETIASLESDGKTAATVANGYLAAADGASLTSGNWDEIAANLNAYGHNISSESNTWQPVSAKHRSVMQGARDIELRRLRAAAIPAAVKRQADAVFVGARTIGSQIGSVTRDQYRNLGDEDRAIVDGLGLLGARRGFGIIPQPVTDFAVKKTGFVGTAMRTVLGWFNRKNRALAVLQRTARGEGQNAEAARKLLNLLEHSNKPTGKLIDEIADAKKGTAADADIRAMLGRRTHVELARFHSEF